MTIPGTFISDSPKVASPSTKTDNTTPPIVPTPPEIATPPSTTMVMTSSSQPSAMLGRMTPMRAVSRTDASPDSRPERVKRPKRSRSTRMPEKRAATGFEPSAKRRRPVAVPCSTTAKTIARTRKIKKDSGVGGMSMK